MVELLGGEVPRQFGQEVVDILDDGLVFSSLQAGKVSVRTVRTVGEKSEKKKREKICFLK